MGADGDGARVGPVAAWSLAVLDAPEVDEFDLDLRLGEHARHWVGMPLLPRDAQSDAAACLPTGGEGAGTTCNTNDATCNATCAGLNTCPATHCNTCGNTVCANTCPNTQCNTCGHTVCANTCPATDCGNTCFCETQNRHVPACHLP